MPSYDYKCTDCKEAFTVERSMKDDSKTKCTECGSEKVSRVWNVFMKAGSSSSGESKSDGGSSPPSCGPCSCC